MLVRSTGNLEERHRRRRERGSKQMVRMGGGSRGGGGGVVTVRNRLQTVPYRPVLSCAGTLLYCTALVLYLRTEPTPQWWMAVRHTVHTVCLSVCVCVCVCV